MVSTRSTPLVTGVSPNTGPPGTRVRIRGENLGIDYTDLLSVKICGVDCTLTAEWKSDRLIEVYVGVCNGKGDIVVQTRTGGIGTSSIGFTGRPLKSIGLVQTTAVWIDEDPRMIINGSNKIASVQDLLDNPLSISVSEEKSQALMSFIETEYQNSTSDIRKENFNPSRFLLENYNHTTFNDLKLGLDNLRKYAVSKTTNSSDTLLKTNISSFMDAIKILKNVHSFSAEDKRNRFSKNLENMLGEILKEAHKIYDQDLIQKDRADLIRTSLEIFERYKVVFSLAKNIEKYLKKDDFEIIISEYRYAKSIMDKAQLCNLRIFDDVKHEIEKSIDMVKKYLIDKLRQFPCNPEEQKIHMDYLYNLQLSNEFDAGWYCLEEEKHWIMQLIIECRDSHIVDEKLSLAQNENNKNGDGQKIDLSKTQPHQRNKFIEEICEIFVEIFSDFWTLANMYNQSLLMPKSAKFVLKPKEQVFGLVSEVLSTFSNIVRFAFITQHTNKTHDSSREDEQKAKLFAIWPTNDIKFSSQVLPHCLKCTRPCVAQINSLDLPPMLFDCLQMLVYDLRRECLTVLLMATTKDLVASLGYEEQDWQQDRSQDIGAYTHMPIRFETAFLKALTLIKEYVLDDRRGEKLLFKDKDFLKQVASHLHALNFTITNRMKKIVRKEEALPSFLTIERSKILLYFYSNVQLLMKKSLPNIKNYLIQHKYRYVDEIFQESKQNALELQKEILIQYKLEAIRPIVDQIETNLYVGKYDFLDAPPPASVRNYVKTIIFNLISVHSQLFSLNKSLIKEILGDACKQIFAELFRLVTAIPQFGRNSSIQLFVDIFCLKETLKEYLYSNETQQLVQKTLALIPKDEFASNQEFMKTLLTEYQARMAPYILVLQQRI